VLEPIYYDRQGRVISFPAWCSLGARGEAYARIALNRAEDVEVSTVWMGIDYNFSRKGPPRIFETMVFGGELDELQWRTATEAGARSAHGVILEVVRATLGGERFDSYALAVALEGIA